MTEPGSGITWRAFLRALAEEIDSVGGLVARDALLRSVGRRMALLNPLPVAPDVAGVELELNGMLADWGWGATRLHLSESERALIISHYGLPVIGSAGDPPGTWLSALLEGLYEGWLAQLPGSDRNLTAKRQRISVGAVTLRYGRNA